MNYFYFLLIIIFSTSCNSGITDGNDLSKSDIELIKKIGILDDGENIILFESHSGQFNGIKSSGNFISNKRLASYWIDEKDSSKTSINYAFYSDIDTIIKTDLSDDWSLSSYLTIKTNKGEQFKLHIGQGENECSYFFNTAISKWENAQNGS